MSRYRYVTPKRLAEIGSSLSERDWAIVKDVATLGIMCGEQLRQLHYYGATKRLARLRLAALAESGVLERIERRVGGQHAGSDGYCYSLGLVGQRLLYPVKRRYWRLPTPGPPFLAHAVGVSQLYTDLRLLERSGGFHLTAFSAEPACWRRYFGPGGTPRWIKPDAHIVIEGREFEDSYFIEVDRSTEFPTRITAKAKAYISYYQSGREQAESIVYPMVAFIVPDDRRRTQIVETLAKLPAEYWSLFTVLVAKQAPSILADGRLFALEREGSS